jgi:hypothetical protein
MLHHVPQAVMPDFLPNISAMLASRQRWQQIAADVASLDISSVDSQEAELMQAIMAAIQAAERDSEETLLHNEITRAVCQVRTGPLRTCKRCLRGCMPQQD